MADLQNILSILVWPVTILALGLVFLRYFHRLFRPRMTRLEFGNIENRFEELHEEIANIKRPQRIEEAVNQKRDRLLNIPNISFHYADQDRIANFYNDYFREPTVQNVVSEMATEISGDIGSKLPQLLEAKAGGKNLSKWISTIKLPETSLNGMFLRYQRETIRNNQVTLGIELVDVELSELKEFESIVNRLDTEFGLHVNEPSLEECRTGLKAKAAERTLKRLEDVSGWVVVEGSFQIQQRGDDFYKCVYRHPITDYMADVDRNVEISFLVPSAAVEAHVAGNYIQSIGTEIPLRMYGEVWQPLNRSKGSWELQVTPLALKQAKVCIILS